MQAGADRQQQGNVGSGSRSGWKHETEIGGKVYAATCPFSHRLLGDALRDLLHDEPFSKHMKPPKLRHDVVDHGFACERQRALLDDFEGSVSCIVLRGDDDVSRARDEIHCASHPLHHLSRNGPIREIAVAGDLHRSQDAHIHMPAADHGESLIAREETGTGKSGHGLLAGIDQVGIFLIGRWRRADSEQAILRLQNDLHPLRHVGCNHGGKADAEVDIETVPQFPGNSPCNQLFGVQISIPRTSLLLEARTSGTAIPLAQK
jgi:hypothetical protein